MLFKMLALCYFIPLVEIANDLPYRATSYYNVLCYDIVSYVGIKTAMQINSFWIKPILSDTFAQFSFGVFSYIL